MSTRSCRDVRADLSAYLDGDLDAVTTDETRVHLESCAVCRSEADVLRLTLRALRRLPELPPPAAILAGVRARLQPEPWYRRLLDRRQWLLGVPVGALATVLVVVGISLFQARYPDMSKTVSHVPLPQSLAPGRQVEPQPTAPPSPVAGTTGAERQAASPAAPSARSYLRAKGALVSATPPQGAASGGQANAPESSAVVDADARDRYRATPEAPAKPVVRTDELAAVESKLEKSPLAQPEPPVKALKDAFRADSPREENRAASIDESAATRPARVLTSPRSGSPVLEERGRDTEQRALPSDKKKEFSEDFARKADRGASLGYAKLAGEKTNESTRIEVVCLLDPDGDSVHDLELLVRREGAVDVVVSALEPPAIREAYAPHRGRLVALPEPSRGWAVTATLQRRALARLLDALAKRASLHIIKQPAAAAATEDSAEALALRITVLR